jgi:hypothetical protein
MFRTIALALGVVTFVAACATTDVQPLTATSFAVTTEADSSCTGASIRQIASQAAAIEVIKRGGDRFIITGQGSDSQLSGMTYAGYGNWNSYGTTQQQLVVQMVERGQANYANALSARTILGADWEAKVAKGPAISC